MIKRGILLVLSGSLLLSTAFADIVDYTLTSGSDKITFALPRDPTVTGSCALSIDCFSVTPVSITVDGTTYNNGTISFYTPANDGGLTILGGSSASNVLVNNNGPGFLQLFTGTLSNPSLENFTNLQLAIAPAFGPQFDEAFLLNGTPQSAATPEPGSYAAVTLLLGALLLVMKFRRGRGNQHA